jgi:hypothetical protein
MRQHPAEGDRLDHAEGARRVAKLGQVRDGRVVQVQRALVAELHDRRRGERLRDRRDAEQRLRVMRTTRLHVRVSVPRRPDKRVVHDDPGRRTGHTLFLHERGDALGELAGDVGDRGRPRVGHQMPFR